MRTIHTGEEVEEDIKLGSNVGKYPRLNKKGEVLEGHGLYILEGEGLTNSNADAAVWREEKTLYDSTVKYKDSRRDEYNRRGATLEVLTVLLWKKEMGEDVQDEIADIQSIRAEVEAKYPKPTNA